MTNLYVAWLNTTTKAAFFNPVGFDAPEIGETVNNAIAVAIGELDAIRTVVDSINVTRPPLQSFEEMLAG